ncbi:MAG: hypothetical protein F7B20_05555 [Aeropyrum sp.]|nr:hypothetical protein [Aeropyrum sp.]
MPRRLGRARAVLGLVVALVAIVRVAMIMAILYLRFWLRLRIWRHVSGWRFRSRLKGLPRTLAYELEQEYDKAIASLTPLTLTKITRKALEQGRRARRGGV